MKRLFALIAVMGLLAAACSSDGSQTCDDVAQSGLDLLQDALDELGAMTIEDVAALGDGEQPAAFDDIERAGDQIDEDAAALGCDEADLEAYVVERVDSLTADGPVAQLVLAQLQAEPESLFSP